MEKWNEIRCKCWCMLWQQQMGHFCSRSLLSRSLLSRSLLPGKENTHHSLFVFFFGDKRTGWHTVLPFCCKIVCSNAVTNTKPMSAAVAVPFWRHMLRNRMKLVVRVHCLLFLLCLLLCLFSQNQYSSEDTFIYFLEERQTFFKHILYKHFAFAHIFGCEHITT